jgi:flagellar hook assembly protein FlgD
LYDAAGRLVRTIANGVRFSGNGSLQWDGRDDSGRVVASGVYWVRVLLDPDDRDGSTTFVRPLTRLH